MEDVTENSILKHEKLVLAYLENTNIMDKVFNSYIYNTAKTAGFSKEPLISEETVSRLLNAHEEFKNELHNAQNNTQVTGGLGFLSEQTFNQYIYFVKIRKNQIGEILFVLSTLLNGKRRAQLQDKLLNFDFVNLLKSLFKEIIWQPLNSFVFSLNIVGSNKLSG